MKVPHVIQNIAYTVQESDPMQLQLQISGYQPDGCSAPVQVMQQRVANTITLEIFRDLPADAMCPQMILDYSATIPVMGTFAAGTYTLTVNDTTITIDL